MNLLPEMIRPLLDVIPVEEYPVDSLTGKPASKSTTQRLKLSKYAKLIETMTDEELKVLIMALSCDKVIEAIKYQDRSCNDKYLLQPEALRRELMKRASILKIAEG